MSASLIRTTLTALVMVAGLVPPAFGQTTPVPQATVVPPAAAVPTVQDLQALNFYVQQADQASVDAEMRRLRIQFPAWVPPDDLSKLAVTQPSTEIDTIYRQIAESDLAGARATIAAAQAQYPNWVPPADMMTLLETDEAQVQLDAALNAGNAAQALQIAIGTQGLLRCDRVNNAWRIAMAQEAQQANDAALATYASILKACTNIPDILSTLEKADKVTTSAELASLFAGAQTRFPANAPELMALRNKLLAGRGEAPADIAIGPDAVPADGATPTGPVAADAAQQTLATVAKIRPRTRPDAVPAKRAPKIAAADDGQSPTASVSVAETPAGGSGPSITPQQCLALTSSSRSAGALAQRGWCAYNLDRPMEALGSFRDAEPRLSGAPRRDARFGMALSYLKLNMTEDASRIAATTDLTPKQRVDTESIILNQRGVLAYKRHQYAQSIAYFDALEQMKGGLPRDLALLRGYAYMNSGNLIAARNIFKTLHNQLATAETRAAMKAAGF